MPLRETRYTGARSGPGIAPPEMAQRRAEMDRAGDRAEPGVEVTPHPQGPGRSEWVRPAARAREGVILFLHGSGYSKGSPASHRPLTARIVRETGLAAYVPDYRLTPEHRYPAALEDAFEAYEYLLGQTAPERIALVGDSAGGGLALATLLAARDTGLPMPAALATMSAWTDLAVTGDPRPDVDDPRVTPAMLRGAADLYLDGADPYDPYASPLHGDLAGLPPLLMQVGGREIMIEDTRRLAEKAREAGVAVTQTVYPGMTHVFQLNQGESPEATAAIAELAAFLYGALAGA